jgi:hypothetical protein
VVVGRAFVERAQLGQKSAPLLGPGLLLLLPEPAQVHLLLVLIPPPQAIRGGGQPTLAQELAGQFLRRLVLDERREHDAVVTPLAQIGDPAVLEAEAVGPGVVAPMRPVVVL